MSASFNPIIVFYLLVPKTCYMNASLPTQVKGRVKKKDYNDAFLKSVFTWDEKWILYENRASSLGQRITFFLKVLSISFLWKSKIFASTNKSIWLDNHEENS